MDGKAVYGLLAAFVGSQGHKNGRFCVASRPLAAKILSNSTLQNSDCAQRTIRIV